jgi:membrane fusion protein (multidrug efflux system)
MSRRNLILVLGITAAAILLTVLFIIRSKSPNAATDSRTAAEGPSAVPSVPVVAVVEQELNLQVKLPGELQAYQDVALYPKIQGFVDWIGVDRGSVVKAGQLLVRMSAPEIAAQRGEAGAKIRVAESQRTEAEARIQGIRAQRVEAEAKLASDEATYRRLKAASATPGVVAGNDVEIAERLVEADRARVKVYEENEKAAQTQVASLSENVKAVTESARSAGEVESYLRVAAPFDGVITERNVHKGSLVGPAGAPGAPPMLRIRQVSRLRLVVSVPETDVGAIAANEKVSFTVPAFPGDSFVGVVQRIAQALDMKTRTMPVELDVENPKGRLAPGMYAEVIWPARRMRPSFFVPASSVATTTERSFVIRIHDGVAEWVDVKRGASMGALVEVFGNLQARDQVATRGTDELREGTRVVAKQQAP